MKTENMKTVAVQKFKSLKKREALKESVKIYVPSTYAVNVKVINDKYVAKIEKELSKLFGGATTIVASGSYVSDAGMLVQEKVNIVNAFTDRLTNKDIDIVIGLCEWLKTEMKQECVSLEVNNELYFI
jgi:hypothetical protein